MGAGTVGRGRGPVVRPGRLMLSQAVIRAREAESQFRWVGVAEFSAGAFGGGVTARRRTEDRGLPTLSAPLTAVPRSVAFKFSDEAAPPGMESAAIPPLIFCEGPATVRGVG